MKKQLLYLSVVLSSICFGFSACSTNAETAIHSASKVKRVGRGPSPILSGVMVPKGYDYFFTSGITPTIADTTAAPGERARYGDTFKQSKAALERIKGILELEGLSMEDVVYLRVYVAPDKHKENVQDYQGWFDGYSEYFNNDSNPNKVARSTVGVHSLVNQDLLVEIEAVAVYPVK